MQRLAACMFPGVVVLGATVVPAGSALGVSIAILPPSTQVLEADAVVIATVLSASDAGVLVKVAQSIKGSAIVGQTVPVSMAKPAYFFDRARFLKGLVGKDVLLLLSSRRDGEGLSLLQYQYSVAPQGLPFSMLALSSAEEHGRFARRVIELEALGSDLEPLFRALLDSNQDADVYAAIDFSEHHLLRHLNAAERSVVRSLALSLLVLDPSRSADEFVTARSVSLAPALAQSLVLPRLGALARSEGRVRQDAAVVLRAQLLPYRARPAAAGESIEATAAEIETWRAADVARFVPLLRAPQAALVRATERLLEWILSASEEEAAAGRALNQGDARVAYWQRLMASRARR